DVRGNITEEAYFGLDGRPTRVRFGQARVAYTYDDRNNRTSEKYLGADGKPTISGLDGSAGYTWKYNERGQLVEVAFFDLESRPVRNLIGIARYVNRHDERGRKVEVTFFDPEGKPVLQAKERAARITTRYDDRGNAIEETWYDTQGRLTRNDNGVA